MSQALIDAPVTTCPAHSGTATILTSWSTTTTDTASGRSTRRASWAAFSDAALPAPRSGQDQARHVPGGHRDTSAMPHAVAGITNAFSTTMEITKQGAVQGRRQLANGKGHAQRQDGGAHRDGDTRAEQRGEQVLSTHARSPRFSAQLARVLASLLQMTRDGCVVELLVDVDQDGVVFDLACVNRDGAAGKHADGLAGGQVVA